MSHSRKHPAEHPRMLPANLPVVAVICTTVLLVVGMVAATAAKSESALEQIIGLLLTTVPSFAALWYAERASRDIRNGTVTEKARQGTVKALEETGVTDVVEAAGRGEASIRAMQALTALLEDRGNLPQNRKE